MKAPGILHPYQIRWLEDDSRFKIGMFARQTGKTFTTTLEIALEAVECEMTGYGGRFRRTGIRFQAFGSHYGQSPRGADAIRFPHNGASRKSRHGPGLFIERLS